MFKNIPFRFTVLSLFIFLSIIIIIFMIYIQTIFIKDFSLDITKDNFVLSSSEVKNNLKVLNKKNDFFIDAISISFEDLNSFEQIIENKKQYLDVLTKILEKNKNLYSTYFAFNDNSFFEIINLDIDKSLRKKYSLSIESRWLLIYIDGKEKEIRKILSYDENLVKIDESESENTYLATSRPWFKKASNKEGQLIKSLPYTFKNINSIGMTYAKKYNDDVIFALDVLLKDLNQSIDKLNSLNTMDSFIFSKTNELITTTTTNKELISKITKLIKENSINTKSIYTINSKDYIINYSKLDDDIYNHLVSIVSLDEVMKEYSKYFDLMIIFTVILFLVLLPIIWYFASIIVEPVLKLIEESKKVKNRKYSDLKKVNSRVFEIQELSNSLLNMSESIYEYQHKLELKVKERTKELKEKNKELRKLSVTDKLTNIYNRIKLDEEIEIQIDRAKRYDENFGVIMIDVDYFKQVNDTYGHQVGDTTLIEIAKILKNNIRKSDIVGRWGGEEFLIIINYINIDDLKALANSIRIKIEEHTFPVIDKKTASFGVSTYQKDDSIKTLLHRADEALYEAKEKGRNCVVIN